MINWPLPSKGNVQEFFCSGGVWQTWTKPRGVDMVMIICIGAGASGGGGLTGIAGLPRGGGGGGGGGGFVRLLVPIILIPDILYVQVGVGGASVGAGTLGNTGGLSTISTSPNTSQPNAIITSGNAAAAAGAAGTSVGGNSGGNGSTAMTNVGAQLANLGLFLALAGGAGSASGTISGANGAIGVQITFGNSGYVCMGGCGGGTVGTNNTDFAGGQVNTAGTPPLFPTIAGGAAGGGAGQPGQLFPKPFRVCGGTGGGSFGSGAVVGGRGGDGAIGCGGGGGGGGVTGGAGGRGGDGYVMIVSW